MRKLWHREISNRSRNQCDTALLGPQSRLLTCLNCSQLVKKLTLLLPIRVTFLWLFKNKCHALAAFVGNEWDSEAFIGSVPELEQSQRAQRSLFLWAPEGHGLPGAFFSCPLGRPGWVSGCGSFTKTKQRLLTHWPTRSWWIWGQARLQNCYMEAACKVGVFWDSNLSFLKIINQGTLDRDIEPYCDFLTKFEVCCFLRLSGWLLGKKHLFAHILWFLEWQKGLTSQ